MRKYEKIETIFTRDMNGSKKLLFYQFRDSTVEFLQYNDWIWSEKIDGTNIRVYWDGHTVTFGGRTDNAQIPAELVTKLNELFGGETNAQIFEQMFGEKEVILFGEGYGRKIQKIGSAYIPDGVDFILFDVLIGDNYQAREWVEKTAQAFGIKVVPIVGSGPLMKAVQYVTENHDSQIADGRCKIEGIVCRPMVELRDRCGNRVIVKIKWEDFKDFSI